MSIQIPSECFGDGDSSLYFLHANGYPPSVYTPLFSCLPEYTIQSMLLRPHWPALIPPSLRNWDPFVDDVHSFLKERQEVDVVVGHSIGATLWLLAAMRGLCRPRKMILIDPAIFSYPVFFGYSFFWLLGLHRRVHPYINRTLKRRTCFDSMEDVFCQYRKKRVFKYFSDESLRYYIESIFVTSTNGVSLAFDVKWEAKIYETGVWHAPYIWRNLKEIDSDILLIYGQYSDVISESMVNRFRKSCPQFRAIRCEEATHLLPLEYPRRMAEYIREFIAK
ncbi:hypothetical protein DID78_01210 [Candidatus Marinamargulisbacteria bacterium SCGC AG-343-D04]|nr:hypothetical protein DID78_01210 [Candidatus Marinamargulisbacteria bacterium SCGC AG-343-D04]